VLAELGRERGDALLQRQHLRIQRVGVVRDRSQQAKAVRAEQSSLRRPHETIGEIERWQFGCVPVTEGLAQPADVVPGEPREPVANASMELAAPLVGDIANRGCPDQIVCQPERPARLDGDAAREELIRRVPRPTGIPAVQVARVRKRQRPRGDCEQRQQCSSVSARSAEARASGGPLASAARTR
jgi:hypothetical protein